MFHHNTIRRYTLALLDFFNDVEIQYKDSNGALVTKKIPIQYRNKEKYEMMDKSFQQEISGNMEVLPDYLIYQIFQSFKCLRNHRIE